MKKAIVWLFVMLLACLVPASAMADNITAYFNDFDAAPTAAPGISASLSGFTTTEGVQGYSGLGPSGNQFGGNFLRNDSTGNPAQYTSLTITGLPTHTSITIRFLLAIIDSWDGSYESNGPYYFNVKVNGTLIFSETFSTRPPSSFVQSYNPPSGGLLTPSPFSNLGWNNIYNDAGYNMAIEPAFQNISHTMDTLVIEFYASGAGWQGGFDESWGIDNLKIEVVTNPVPLPGAALLLGSGLLCLAAYRRHKSGSAT
jgi:hypothetical protein